MVLNVRPGKILVGHRDLKQSEAIFVLTSYNLSKTVLPPKIFWVTAMYHDMGDIRILEVMIWDIDKNKIGVH